MKCFFNIVLCCIFIVLLAACSNEEALDLTSTYSFSHEGQEIELVYFFEEILNYTELEANQTNEETFTKTVLEPFEEKSSLTTNELTEFFSETTNLNQLEEKTHELIDRQAELNETIEKTMIEAIDLLPGEDTSFYIIPVNPDDWFTINNMKGIAGAAFFDNKVLLIIDPAVDEEMIQHTVAHEYNHTVHMAQNGSSSMATVLDGVITEGKADVFANILYPNTQVPWLEPLTDDEETATLEKLTDTFDSTLFVEYDDFLFGNSSANIPQWANYKIGYQIVENFLDLNPNVPVLEWTTMDADELVKQTDYRYILE